MKIRVMNRLPSNVFSALVAGLMLSTLDARAQEFPAPPEQMAQYDASVHKTIIELQPFRRQQTSVLPSGTEVTLISLNPNLNATFLLMLGAEAFHIENPDPVGQQITLAANPIAAVVIVGPETTMRCNLWTGAPSEFRTARDSGLPFAPLCDAKLYLRNAIPGSRSSLEHVTDFLRDHVWQGEQIVQLVKESFYRDQFSETTDLVAATAQNAAPTGPEPALIEPKYADQAIAPIGFGIALADPDQKQMIPGVWYSAAAMEGVYASAIQPQTISADILNGPGSANRLDSVEGKAVEYLVAFDMARYGIGFALGTDHPRVDWSPRPSAAARIRGLPGPDGIGDASPLVRSGMVSPDYVGRTIATFAGGFKRQHGAFKFGDYALIDTGKHYGFIEKGVIYSKLKTELSTLYVLDDGTTGMKTWKGEGRCAAGPDHVRPPERCTADRDRSRDRCRHAGRQGHAMGRGQLVGVGQSGTAHLARRGLHAGNRRPPLSDLWLFLDRHALCHGADVSGLWVQLRHASGHERTRTDLPRPLPAPGWQSACRTYDYGHVAVRQEGSGRQRHSAFPGVRGQSRSVLHLQQGEPEMRRVGVILLVLMPPGGAGICPVSVRAAECAVVPADFSRNMV